MTELQSNTSPPSLFAPALLPALAQRQLLSPGEIARAQAAAAAADQRLDRALLELGLLSETALRDLLRHSFGVEEVADGDLPATPVCVDQLRAAFLATAQVLPLATSDKTLTLAMVDPFDDFVAHGVALKTNRTLLRRRIPQQRLEAALAELYGMRLAAGEPHEGPDIAEARGTDIDTLRDAASDAPVIRFVQEAFRAAVEAGASDIHLKPGRSGASMQFRINGNLVPQIEPGAKLYPSIISRLKILANLDISERRLPQDGRIRTSVAGQPVDIRVSTMPHIHGEAAVLRLLSRELAVSRLGELGFSPAIEAGLEQLLTAKDGLVLVTGPTGSGKSTTLHAALKQLIRPDLNVVTIEDPVEYRVDGAAQIQVDEKIGLTFPRVLRSLLRQDPDIILVGEIRDAETAKISVQAALTGHLVLATLHTNSAPAAIPRLIDMGVEPYLLTAVLRGVLAQRLVRRRCTACDGSGDACVECGGAGVSGRLAIGELLVPTAQLTTELAGSLAIDIELAARLSATGYRPMREDAERRVAAGEIDRSVLAGLIDVD